MRLAPLLLFALVAGILHFATTDPFRVYCEDIENGFLPQTAYTYQHPWEAFAGKPTPSCNFGTSNYLTDGRPAAIVPFWAELLARVAPTDPWRHALFEWRVTSLYLLGSMAALYWFLRRAGVGVAIAAACACCWPFAFTVFHEWRHPDLMRGRLMIAPVLAGLWWATRRGGWRGWLLLAAATILCMAQAAQLYWVAALVAYWVAASAWLERRRLLELMRTEGARVLLRAAPPATALLVVVIALAPVYLRGQAVMRRSAFFWDLVHDPAHFLLYLRDGRDWFSLGSLFGFERGLLVWSLAGLCVLAVLAARHRRSGAPPLLWPGDSRRLVALGLPLFAVSLALSFVPDLPFDLFAVREGRLEWRFAPLAAPTAFAVVFHTTQRTWLVLAEVGALLAGAGALAAWCATTTSARARAVTAGGAVALFVALQAAASAASTEAWPRSGQLVALAVVAAVIATVGAAAQLAGRPRRLAQTAVVALAVLVASRASAAHYRAGSELCRHGETSALVQLARDRSILARMPAEVRSQREYRLFGDKWCYLLDAPCALSYGLRTLPREVARFFEAAGAVEHRQMPYWLHLDYALLIETGVAQMLGIKWWILPADVMEGGVLLTGELDPSPLRMLEARGVFEKGWALASWETAGSFEEAVRRVVEIGRAGELRTHGVVQTTAEGPLELAAPARTGAALAPAAPPAAVELLEIEPGRLRFRVRSGSATVLATNEFFHPDWRASVGERAAPAIRVNGAFVGVAVPAGEHEVVIER